ncbi:PP2C family serine/threonine-protein phosphatase [Flammeovirga kamogawensis]|uniref:SpoIIE family protein phosphatase n=1 Tax=Flammeovirga kamogawensis TaxID=373891 RepID=A0ABX8H4G5_9BACT|nr:SpoIIE family protein phosphatase [Flammeovirga kamogawensis]MBB6461836.1 serine/threonine protein phosphatase PrpC [Flammeovirga kamogawensis]QWG10549.1 SpoIIE family protein phosphatase [Flammeovirga kamogawensis]
MDKIVNIDIGGYTRPITGEKRNGDVIYILKNPRYIFFAIIDGIGHGDVANAIAEETKSFLIDNHNSDIQYVIQKAHEHMLGTEGAVIGIGCIIDDNFSFGSLGNINCKIVNAENFDMLSTDGLLGVRGRTPKITSKKLNNNDVIFMFSDGINGNFNSSEFNNYHLFSSEILAKKIVKNSGSPFDDASMITVKVQIT